MRTGWDLAFSNSYNVPRAGAATVPRPTIILPEHCEEILTRECGPAEVEAEAAADVEDEGCCCATGEHNRLQTMLLGGLRSHNDGAVLQRTARGPAPRTARCCGTSPCSSASTTGTQCRTLT